MHGHAITPSDGEHVHASSAVNSGSAVQCLRCQARSGVLLKPQEDKS